MALSLQSSVIADFSSPSPSNGHSSSSSSVSTSSTATATSLVPPLPPLSSLSVPPSQVQTTTNTIHNFSLTTVTPATTPSTSPPLTTNTTTDSISVNSNSISFTNTTTTTTTSSSSSCSSKQSPCTMTRTTSVSKSLIDTSERRNKRKNFKPRSIVHSSYEEDDDEFDKSIPSDDQVSCDDESINNIHRMNVDDDEIDNHMIITRNCVSSCNAVNTNGRESFISTEDDDVDERQFDDEVDEDVDDTLHNGTRHRRSVKVRIKRGKYRPMIDDAELNDHDEEDEYEENDDDEEDEDDKYDGSVEGSLSDVVEDLSRARSRDDDINEDMTGRAGVSEARLSSQRLTCNSERSKVMKGSKCTKVREQIEAAARQEESECAKESASKFSSNRRGSSINCLNSNSSINNNNNNTMNNVDKLNETSEFGGDDRPLKGKNNNANVSSLMMMGGSDFVMPLDLSSASASNYLTGDLVKSVKVTSVNQVKSSMSLSSSFSSPSSNSHSTGTTGATVKTTTTTSSSSSSSSSPSSSATAAASSSSCLTATASSPICTNKSRNNSPSMIGLGFCKPGLYSGIAPWIDPTFLSQTGAFPDKYERPGPVDYTRYVKRFANAAECGNGQCREFAYREHFHCLDCNARVFAKKEEMIRHFKWHKKRDESLQHGFLRYSPSDDCTDHFPRCPHNRKQTHYHCLKRGCDKVYISTSDVQMHANYHRKDTAIIQEGFQRFRATEDCLTDYCPFMGQKTTHFHCRRDNCNHTFKNKADMEKHKSFHVKDEQLTRDGFKKFMKHETCSYGECRFSRVCNHIHCIRPGCSHVFHSSGQLYSHKRKHEKSDSDADASPCESQNTGDSMFRGGGGGGGGGVGESSYFSGPPVPSSLPPVASIAETYPTGTTLMSIDGLPIFKRKRGRPPKNQVPEVAFHNRSSLTSPASNSLHSSLHPHHLASLHLQASLASHSSSPSSSPSPFHLTGAPVTTVAPTPRNSSSPSACSSATPRVSTSNNVSSVFTASKDNSHNSSPVPCSQLTHPSLAPLAALSPYSLAAAMNGNSAAAAAAAANFAASLSQNSSDGLIPVPILPILQLFNLPCNSSLYTASAASSTASSAASGPAGGERKRNASPDHDLATSDHQLNSDYDDDTVTNDTGCSGGGGGSDSAKRHKVSSTQQVRILKDEPVPSGYLRFRFNEDCKYTYCSYREHQTHFHCTRESCGYSFCDKTRFVQHTARHERLDTLMGEDFQQFRSNIDCGRYNCSFACEPSSTPPQSNKGSHFHCLKCEFTCTDTNRVVAHRRLHQKMDGIAAAGFQKFTPSVDCTVQACNHNRRQTHYHCNKCQYTVLGLSQMNSHKYRHSQE